MSLDCCKSMHRRAQKAEGQVLKLQRQLEKSRPAPWASAERQAEAVERDKTAAVIQQFESVRREPSGSVS